MCSVTEIISEQPTQLNVTQGPCLNSSSATTGNCRVVTIGLGIFLVVLAAFTIANFCLVMQVSKPSILQSGIELICKISQLAD